MSLWVDMAPGLAWTRAGGVTQRVVDSAFRARKFAREVIRPVALEIDERIDRDHDYFPWDVVRAGARDGWMSAWIPRAWGGDGGSISEYAACMEELCAGCAGIANIYGASGLGMLPIMLSFDVDIAGRILGDIMAHQLDEHPMLCAFAITEPGAGSDVEEAEGLATGDIRTCAVKVDGGYRITGRKVFISNGREAEYVVVYAALDRADPASSWTSFVVRRGSPGYRCARVERKMGQRACAAAELEFDDVFVPSDMLLGEEGGAWRSTRQVLAISRGPVGSIATGIARDAYEAAVEYQLQGANGSGAPEPEPWKDDLVAAMAVRVRTARAAYLEAAIHCDEVLMPPAFVQELAARVGKVGAARRVLSKLTGALLGGKEEAWAHQALLGSTAKVAGSDAAMWVTGAALDVIPVWAGRLRKRAEKAFRDAKLTQIYEGTNQINLRSIAHETWRRPASPG